MANDENAKNAYGDGGGHGPEEETKNCEAVPSEKAWVVHGGKIYSLETGHRNGDTTQAGVLFLETIRRVKTEPRRVGVEGGAAMVVNDDIRPAAERPADYKTLTRQTETFIRECLEHVENESEPAPDEWLENAWAALEVWYTLAGEWGADKAVRETDQQRLEALIVQVESGGQ